jgi:hypothetical protein
VGSSMIQTACHSTSYLASLVVLGPDVYGTGRNNKRDQNP